jgi:hypothetical protein
LRRKGTTFSLTYKQLTAFYYFFIHSVPPRFRQTVG